MKLFHWNTCEALSRVGWGHIIVMAHDLEFARLIAERNFVLYLMEDESAPRHWVVDLYGPDVDKWDEDDQQEYFDLIKRFKADIAKEPVDNKIALFIQGSE
jgi:hypothetical protein